jgi:uncharacterized membrane protein
MKSVIAGVVNSPVKSFVFIAVLFGGLLIFLTPPFTGADEEAHFARAYSITTGHLILHDTTKVSVPTSFRKTIGCFQTKTDQPGVLYRYQYDNYGREKKLSFECALHQPLRQNDTEMVHTSAFAYSPLAYIPQTIAILLARLFQLPIVAMSYLVRLSVLLEYIVMIALAIKLLPVRKWALAGAALLPTAIMFINNPSGDHVLFGSAALITAIIIRSISIPNNQLQKEDTKLTIALVVLSILVVLAKGIFPGACLVPLILFYGGFHHKKIRKMAIVMASLAVGVLWQKFGVNLALVSQVDASSILDFPKAFIKTMFYRWVDTDFLYVGDYVGNVPHSGEHLGMPSIIVTTINILLAVYLFVGYPEKSELRISEKQRRALQITVLGCAAAIIVGSFAALFVGVSYLHTANGTIRGVQTRYLYPAFIVLATLPFARRITASERAVSKIVIWGSILALTFLVVINAISFRWILG